MSSNHLPTDYQAFIHTSRYARWLDKENRRETWAETVHRYMENVVHPLLSADTRPVSDEIEQAILSLEITPSMRAMMTAGKALQRDHTAGYNCSYLPVDDPKSFDEAMFILLCGTGVGFSVERQYITKLPEVPDQLFVSDHTIVVHDSKEGWAKAFRTLLALLYAGEIPKWDTSRVRPAGARLKTFGGRASGPAPLVELFNFSINLFKQAAGRKLNSVECHDLMCKIGEVVVVGGVRRSAMISLSNLSDDRMRHAKSGQWWEKTAHRALANNSVAYTEKPDMETFLREWTSLVESKSGERGIFSRAASKRQAAKNGRRDPSYEFGTNPCCVSAETQILTSKGNIPIKDTVGKQVSIWNGDEWATVVPYEAGEGELVRVLLSDGSSLDCTWNHRWVVRDEYFVKTEELELGAILETFDIPGQETRVRSIVSITPTDRYEMTYCFTEPKTSRGTFNGIVTGNSEIILRPYQFCNLTEIVVRATDTVADLERKVQLATILGTIQSTMTNFPYLRKIWTKNTEEERLLGVSMTGIMDNPMMVNSASGLEDMLKHLRQVAVATNAEWAAKLGINPSTAITAIKPSGTVSQLVDSASGIHARHSEYYIRTVRGDNKDPLTQFMKEQGVPSEPCVMKPETTTVFSFPQKSPHSAITRNDMTALEQLEMWLVYQRHWCEHKPSVTVTVRDHEWLEVGAWVYRNFDEVSGISFLPHSDHSYQQAPYQEITKAEYEQLLSVMPERIDWVKLSEYEMEDTTKASQQFACSAGVCEIVDIN